MDDLLAPFGRHVLSGRRSFMRNHRHDLAAENLLVGRERFLAFSIEQQIGVQFHRTLLWN
jgi:hypothetical protein